ncbi:hypothetical protein FSP39_009245 [Pinctada imbricata]|uniref:Uncharacterized protein n=1 Tax=Pinctada imbricata TaxID=66713 RepID=A0AA88YJD6_PINIB|nr:hypothetical protein FSP39_009245 [Pinctada imbricata]
MEDIGRIDGGEGGKEKEENSRGGFNETEVDWGKVPTPAEDGRGQEPESTASPFNHFGRFLTAEEFVKRLNEADGKQSDGVVDGDDAVNQDEKEALMQDEEQIPRDIASPVGSVKRTLAIIGTYNVSSPD